MKNSRLEDPELIMLIEEILGFNLNYKQLAYLRGEEVFWERQDGKTTADIIYLLFSLDSPLFVDVEAKNMMQSEGLSTHVAYSFFKNEIIRLAKLFEEGGLSPRSCVTQYGFKKIL